MSRVMSLSKRIWSLGAGELVGQIILVHESCHDSDHDSDQESYHELCRFYHVYYHWVQLYWWVKLFGCMSHVMSHGTSQVKSHVTNYVNINSYMIIGCRWMNGSSFFSAWVMSWVMARVKSRGMSRVMSPLSRVLSLVAGGLLGQFGWVHESSRKSWHESWHYPLIWSKDGGLVGSSCLVYKFAFVCICTYVCMWHCTWGSDGLGLDMKAYNQTDFDVGKVCVCVCV